LPYLHKISPRAKINILNDGDINDAQLDHLNRSFDILVLGHQEYVTQKEYDNLKLFVLKGGVLVCLDGNLFYGEVSYNESAHSVSFIKGHRFSFDGKRGWWGDVYERWANDTSNWLGSNFFVKPFALYEPADRYESVNLSLANDPFHYGEHEEQYLTNPNDNIIKNYGAVISLNKGEKVGSVAGGLPHPVIATYVKTYGLGRVIVLGIYADKVMANPSFINFLSNVIIHYALKTL
jgi:hypothetical protein